MGNRLIEFSFPLKQASLDSLHEKNVRHGHISTLHIWPARRPLAACRAALIATLLPDPGTPEARKQLVERIGGRVVQNVKKKKLPTGKVEEKIVEETEGGILHWGRESSPDLEWFREKIREAYGGRAPRVLDPFAGGGAIPLEAMRLGCEATAIDINPVAWLVLKCTLEYPQKLAGQTRPLPRFALESREFMEVFYKRTRKLSKRQLEDLLNSEQLRLFDPPAADLSWHIRAWGWWVLQQAKADLAKFYPTIDGKPTVAYLWARTVTCKNCRAPVPLLKTRWLCKRDNKRVLLTMAPNPDKTGVIFGVQNGVPQSGGNAAQRREHDKRIGAGTMSRSGATCPSCSAIMTMEDLRLEGRAKRMGAVMTAVVVDGENGREYRLPTQAEIELAREAEKEVPSVFATIPFGLPTEPTPGAAGSKRNSSSLQIFGFNTWQELFTPRQLLALGMFVRHTRSAAAEIRVAGYPHEWAQALCGYLALAVDRLADRSSSLCSWVNSRETIRNTFGRFAFPMVWDFAEVCPSADATGGFYGAIEWVSQYTSHALVVGAAAPKPTVLRSSAMRGTSEQVDIIVTDPPYYDAIMYSDLMDFFYVWLRRTLWGFAEPGDGAFEDPLTPKWDHEQGDGELVDDPGRHGWDLEKSRRIYQDGMFRAFQACHRALAPDGRFVIVFAHKHPDAWESLVSGIIRAGFVVDGSWPIQTEMSNRTRARASAALSSSVWLVCKQRPLGARPGWDNAVMDQMRKRLITRLREFWDAGVRGPDFVWAATGPALEVFSQHPVVKKANEPGKVMEVSEFLMHVRRLVVEFVVGQVLSHNGDDAASGLDDVTTYYLLHRHDFGMGDVPAGACILYAVSCGLSDAELADRFDLLLRTGGQEPVAEDEEEDVGAEAEDADATEGSGSTVKLRPWHQRKRKSMGYDTDGKPAPLIDQIHRLMHLWKAGDVVKVDEYVDDRGFRRSQLFHQVLQALIELADVGSDERSLLESISNHVASRGLPTGQERFQV